MSGIERIILVDDNDLDNEYHQIVLRQAGYQGELLVFETGMDLLGFMASAAPPLRTCVFLDINMPILSGFDTLERLAPLARDRGQLEVHILTSSDALQDRERAAAAPLVRQYLVKPLTTATVRAILEG